MSDFVEEDDRSCEDYEDDEQDNDSESYTYEDDDEDYTYESDEAVEMPPLLERAYSEEIFHVPEGVCVFVNYKGMQS
jgi:hypothetical protein